MLAGQGFERSHPRRAINSPRRSNSTPIAAIALCLAASHALAGPCWEEPPISDAGPTPTKAQIPRGTGAIADIMGSLDGAGPATGEVDFQDMYLIQIDDPAAFNASTAPEFGGAANFPTALWLFKASATAALANRGFSPDFPGAVLLPEATDATGFILTEPGLYYLAITPQASIADAGSLASLPMFQFDDPLEISGPDGPGANLPLVGWSSEPFTGNYSIALTGVSFAAPPCPGDLNFDGIVNAADLGILLANFGCGAGLCPGDIDDNGIVDAADLGILLSAFGTQCGPFGACCLPDGTCSSVSVYQCQELGGLFQGRELSCADAACGTPTPSNCCSPQNAPGCEDPICQTIICANDPFCCEVEWDTLCANSANNTPECHCP